jgi:hypothetical protein
MSINKAHSFIDKNGKDSFIRFCMKRMGYIPTHGFDSYEDQHDICVKLMERYFKAKSTPQLQKIIIDKQASLSFFRDDLWGIVRLFMFIKGYNIGLHCEFDKDVFKALQDFRKIHSIYVRPLNSDIAVSSEELLAIIDVKKTSVKESE